MSSAETLPTPLPLNLQAARWLREKAAEMGHAGARAKATHTDHTGLGVQRGAEVERLGARMLYLGAAFLAGKPYRACEPAALAHSIPRVERIYLVVDSAAYRFRLSRITEADVAAWMAVK